MLLPIRYYNNSTTDITLCPKHPCAIIASWASCGHCKSAVPFFKKLYDDSTNDDRYHVIMLDYNKHRNLIKSLGINKFPTILVHDPTSNKVYHYTNKRDTRTMQQFMDALPRVSMPVWTSGSVDVYKISNVAL